MKRVKTHLSCLLLALACAALLGCSAAGGQPSPESLPSNGAATPPTEPVPGYGVAGPPTGLAPGTTYVSWQCIYMNPLSSYAAAGGNSAYRYEVGEDYFATIRRGGSLLGTPGGQGTENGGEPGSRAEVKRWRWQRFPYTDEEWEALFIPSGFGMPGIGSVFDEVLYQPLDDNEFLLSVDGALWLVELGNNPQMGTYIWSIYSLVPEEQMGGAEWELHFAVSALLPYFRFEFGMEHTEVSAVCTQSQLVDFDTPADPEAGHPIGSSLTLDGDRALYWAPWNESGTMVDYAEIHFTVRNGNEMPLGGTIYIEYVGGENANRRYTASLVGTGLYLAQHAETEGAVITVQELPGK